jgi:hypothetical protein
VATTAEVEQFRTATDKVDSGLGGLLVDRLLMPVTVLALRARAQMRDSYAGRVAGHGHATGASMIKPRAAA